MRRLIASRTAEIAARRSAGSAARYSSTVFAERVAIAGL
jgi:hypothetical protein